MPRIKFNKAFQETTPSLFDSLEMEYREEELPSRVRFISFGSGSSGNCAYIGNDNEGFLIDAGVSPENVIPELRRRGISMSKLKGICITHDHSDHIRYVYKILKRHTHMALFSTPKTLSGIFRRHSLSPRLKDYHKPIYIETPFKIGAFTITAFQTLHDGTDNVGFFIESGNVRFAIATDLGSITDRVEYYMRKANYIMLESNYDAKMLQDGKYPHYLKARIAAPNGHLDNVVTSQFLADIHTPALHNIFLCHLSNENNEPEIALETLRRALEQKGITVGDSSGEIDQRDADIQIYALPRFESSLFFTLK